MASKSGRSVAPSDMVRLLDLLNSSESNDDGFNDAAPRPEYQTDESAEKVEETSEIFPVESDSSNLATAAQETVENRFAAHIVHGMSKFIRP